MGYFLDSHRAQLLTVNGRLAGQEIITRFWYAYIGGFPNPDVPESTFFLQEFRTAFRAQILASFYSTYTVASYEIKEMTDALMVAPGPPSKWRPIFDVNKLDLLVGAGADVGALGAGAGTLCPAHEALRIFQKPTTRRLGFFKGNYWRISAGFPDTLKDPANREKWLAGTTATYDVSWGGFVATAIFGQAAPVGTGFFPCCMSVPYFGRVVKPAGGDVRDAASKILGIATSGYIGTQTTRRFQPSGLFRGK